MFEDASKALGPKADDAARKDYLSRFGSNHWLKILKIVLEVSGPALDGTMAKLNNPDNLVRKHVLVRFSVTN